jgi:hypothetical protein
VRPVSDDTLTPYARNVEQNSGKCLTRPHDTIQNECEIHQKWSETRSVWADQRLKQAQSVGGLEV